MDFCRDRIFRNPRSAAFRSHPLHTDQLELNAEITHIAYYNAEMTQAIQR